MRDEQMLAFEQALTAGNQTRGNVSPERLRLMGKQASVRYAKGGVALTDAVVDVLREQPGLGPDHVRRVTEFANTYAFDDAFHKEAGLGHRVVSFQKGPADPSSVIKELRLNPTSETTGPSFAQPTSYVPGEDSLRSAFRGHQKTAGQMERTKDYSYANPNIKMVSLLEQLTSAQEKIASDLSSLEVAYDSSADVLYRESRNVLHEGYSPADVASAVASVASHSNFVKLALKMISSRMDNDGVPAPIGPKVASVRLVNNEHPLCRATTDFEKVAAKRFNHVAALEQLNGQVKVVRRKLWENVQ